MSSITEGSLTDVTYFVKASFLLDIISGAGDGGTGTVYMNRVKGGLRHGDDYTRGTKVYIKGVTVIIKGMSK